MFSQGHWAKGHRARAQGGVPGCARVQAGRGLGAAGEAERRRLPPGRVAHQGGARPDERHQDPHRRIPGAPNPVLHATSGALRGRVQGAAVLMSGAHAIF